MGSTRRHFTAEYKANAVALVLDDGRSIAEAARNIGVLEKTLGKWVKKARDDGEESQRPLDEDAVSRVITNTVPLSRTMDEQIKAIKSWAHNRALSASRESAT